MYRIALSSLAALLLLCSAAAPSHADCAVNIKVENDNSPESGVNIWLWFQTSGSRVKKTGGAFWNHLCGSGDRCTCPQYISVHPGEEYTCSTTLESSCSSDDRDFDLIYDEGTSETDKWVVGGIKAKRNIEVWDGKTITFTWQ